jgi:phosphonate transport system substrate-binding protein
MKRFLAGAVALALLVAGCGGSSNTGTQNTTPAAGNPSTPAPEPKIEKLVIGFVPSQEAGQIGDKVKPMTDFLAKELGMKEVTSFVGTNFIGVIEAMGSKQVDIGFLNPFGYVLASADHGAQVILKSVRRGAHQYRAQFMARADSGIPVCDQTKDADCKATLAAMKGKKFAFVDAASTSGYLFPANFLKSKGIELEKGKFFSDVTNAGAHDNSAKAVLNKDVAVGVSFEDVRSNLQKEFPNIKKDVSVIMYTDWIPNDTVSVRKGLPADLVQKVEAALLKYASTAEGKKVLKDLYTIDGFAKGKDADYDVVRATAKSMNINLRDTLSGKK